MKLIGELKDKVDNAETLEEKKSLIANVGIELTDEELNQIAGGIESADVVGVVVVPTNPSTLPYIEY